MKHKRICSAFLALLLVLSAFTVVPFAAEGGWDGTTAAQPTGSGTQEDPYLISSAANLLWMSQNIKKGDTVQDDSPEVEAGEYGPSFAGVYFKQTCDIDLGGRSLPSIGYYYANDARMAAFGGVYDGNGYSIRGGSIVSVNDGHEFNHSWGHGLFGVIYGATIRNVRLEDMTIQGHGVTGGIVGRAAAPVGSEESPAAADETFNLIESCTVAESCGIAVQFPAEQTSTSGDYDQAGRVGGIVGMAYGATVKNCVNGADIAVPGNFSYGGGIAGTAGFGVLIENCVNTGSITLTIGDNPNKAESGYGGIVGFVSPYDSGVVNKFADGDLVIRSCYNTGSFAFVGTTSSNAVYWGGILGGANTLQPNQLYRISGCYNLNGKNVLEAKKGGDGEDKDQPYANFRIGGLLGVYWIAGGADVSPLYIDHSYSVEITEGGNTSGYGGTNEYRCYPDRKNTAGLGCVQIGLADGSYADALNGSYPENATVGTKTADEIQALADEIDRTIAANSPVQFDTWDGSADTSWFDPDNIQTSYEIDSAAKLAGLTKLVGESDAASFPQAAAGTTVTFYVTANLDLSGWEWLPIGSGDTRFGGKLIGRVGEDGAPAVIRGLKVTAAGANAGFVGAMDEGGEISNFKFESPRITGASDAVAVVCGSAASGGTFTDITVTDARLEAENAKGVGGICADAGDGAAVFTDCVFDGDLVADGLSAMVGGIVGNAAAGATMTGCYVSGSIAAAGTTDQVGGMVGAIGAGAALTMTDCQFDGFVHNANAAASATGALVGSAAAGETAVSLTRVFLSGVSMGTGENPAAGFAWFGALTGSGSVTLTAQNCSTLTQVSVAGNTDNTVTLTGGDTGITVYKLSEVAGENGKTTVGDTGWTMRQAMYPVLAVAQYAAPSDYANADYAWFDFAEDTMEIGSFNELVGFSALSKLYHFGGKTVRLSANIDGITKLPGQTLGAGGALNDFISTGFSGTFDRNGFSILNVEFELGAAATFLITWVVGAESYTESYKYGETPTFKGETTRPDDEKYRYTFNGWDEEIVPVVADATYTAKWKVSRLESSTDSDEPDESDETPQNTEPAGGEQTNAPAGDDKGGCQSAAGMSLLVLGIGGAVGAVLCRRKPGARSKKQS